jgi:hypothetical protein
MPMILSFGVKRTVSLLALIVAGAFAACGGDSAGSAIDGFPVTKCTVAGDCKPGTHCGVKGECTVECSPTVACAAGMTCALAEGRCVTGSAAVGGSSGVPLPGTAANPGIPIGTSGSGGSGGGCAFSQAEFKQETPNVMLVVDRSRSMEEDFGTDTRWNVLRNALINPTDGFVTALETQIRFGLTMYTGPLMSGGGAPPPPRGGSGGAGGGTATATGGTGGTLTECPILAGVPIALNNFAPISASYTATEPLGNTPTGASIAAIWPQIQALDPALFPGPRVMVLATDGEPNTCTSLTDNMEGRALSEAAIQAAYDAGIQTFVISVGDEVGEDHLRRIANLGQGFPVNDRTERFYPANDPSELSEAFTTIINGIRACVFDLNGTVMVNSAAQGRVTVDGVALTYMDPNGWHLNGNGQVVVDGEGCQKIQQGAQGIDIWFPCGVFTPE